MAEIEVELRNVAETGAALGWAGAHTLVVDRPDGKAGGQGLCKDLRYAAAELGAELADIAVSVKLTLEGSPLVATGAEMTVRCTGADEREVGEVIAHATRNCTVANSVRAGFPVDIRRGR